MGGTISTSPDAEGGSIPAHGAADLLALLGEAEQEMVELIPSDIRQLP